MSKVIYDVLVEGRPAKTTKAVLLDDLRIPIHIVLGRFEAASQEELEDLITDLRHELDRRSS